RMGDLEDFGFWILDCGLVNQSIQNPQSKIQNRISHGTDIAVDWKMVLGKESLGAAVEYLRLLSSDGRAPFNSGGGDRARQRGCAIYALRKWPAITSRAGAVLPGASEL